MLSPMAYRRAAAMATVAAAGVASAVWRRTMAGGSGGTGGGLVPGQDTPVHERDLPENLKKDFRQVRQAVAAAAYLERHWRQRQLHTPCWLQGASQLVVCKIFGLLAANALTSS